MEPGSLLADARHRAQLSQDELAQRAGTSRPTLSSYEHGHRSPTLSTAVRILTAADHELTAVPIVRFDERHHATGAHDYRPNTPPPPVTGACTGHRAAASAPPLVDAAPLLRPARPH
jgi:transcriptional regulator with XRE-family HTH domain